jgi:hypothetical protein
MRNALGFAIAAVLMGAAPAAAQMRGMRVMSRIGPARMAPRAVPFAAPRPAPPPVRVIYVRPAPISLQAARPVISRPPTQRNLFPTSADTTTVEPSNSAFAPFGGTPIPLGQFLNPVPGLGFDYTHLAAINSGLAVRAFIDPITQHELATVESLPEEAPVGLGFFPAISAESPEFVGAPQPQVIILQQPVPETAQVAPGAARPAPAAAVPPTPPLPVGVLYLIRRDGTAIKAIAFSQHNGEVVYITADGVRHTIAVSQLDIKATEQRNAEHGAIVHLTA